MSKLRESINAFIRCAYVRDQYEGGGKTAADADEDSVKILNILTIYMMRMTVQGIIGIQ